MVASLFSRLKHPMIIKKEIIVTLLAKLAFSVTRLINKSIR